MTVLEGNENLQPMSEDEQETLANYEAAENQRLGCQAVIQGDLVIENP
jgi:ferredoxin